MGNISKMQTYISREQDYALRITATLAGLKNGNHLSVKELSQKLYISRNFAARIVHNLKHKGILGTKQGHTGGVYLNINADELSVYDVLNAVGFKIKFNQCLSADFNCDLVTKCRFHCFFYEQEYAFTQNMKAKKISEFLF